MTLKDHQQQLMASGQVETAQFIGSLIDELEVRDERMGNAIVTALQEYDAQRVKVPDAKPDWHSTAKLVMTAVSGVALPFPTFPPPGSRKRRHT